MACEKELKAIVVRMLALIFHTRERGASITSRALTRAVAAEPPCGSSYDPGPGPCRQRFTKSRRSGARTLRTAASLLQATRASFTHPMT